MTQDDGSRALKPGSPHTQLTTTADGHGNNT